MIPQIYSNGKETVYICENNGDWQARNSHMKAVVIEGKPTRVYGYQNGEWCFCLNRSKDKIIALAKQQTA